MNDEEEGYLPKSRFKIGDIVILLPNKDEYMKIVSINEEINMAICKKVGKNAYYSFLMSDIQKELRYSEFEIYYNEQVGN
jgi:hypothetical protein